MLKQIVSKAIRKFISYQILVWLFPKKYLQRYENAKNTFVLIKEPITKTTFWFYIPHQPFFEYQLHNPGLYEGWEKVSLKLWVELCLHSDTIIDVGANTGIYTLLAAVAHPKALIYALEPIPGNHKYLEQNLSRNNMKVQFLPVAASNYNGKATMYQMVESINYMTSVNANLYEIHPEIKKDQTVESIDVATQTLDSLIQTVKGKLLIKIDVEGHEVQVLEGMKMLLVEYKPSLLVEIFSEKSADVFNAVLVPLGYVFIAIDEVNEPQVVPKIIENNHHNFVAVQKEIAEALIIKNLIQT